MLPLGVLLVSRMIPEVVMRDCRERAERTVTAGRPVSRVGAAIIVTAWIALALVGIVVARRAL